MPELQEQRSLPSEVTLLRQELVWLKERLARLEKLVLPASSGAFSLQRSTSAALQRSTSDGASAFLLPRPATPPLPPAAAAAAAAGLCMASPDPAAAAAVPGTETATGLALQNAKAAAPAATAIHALSVSNGTMVTPPAAVAAASAAGPDAMSHRVEARQPAVQATSLAPVTPTGLVCAAGLTAPAAATDARVAATAQPETAGQVRGLSQITAAAAPPPASPPAALALGLPPYLSPYSAGMTLPGATSGGVPMGRTRVVMHQVVLPAEVDSLGVCFGGQVLSWVDITAGLSAKTLAKGPCVTATLDAVHFLRPCRMGTVVIIAAMVNRTFNSSMEVGVRVEAEDMRTGVRHHCCSAYLTFVAQRAPPPRASFTGTTTTPSTLQTTTPSTTGPYTQPNSTSRGAANGSTGVSPLHPIAGADMSPVGNSSGSVSSGMGSFGPPILTPSSSATPAARAAALPAAAAPDGSLGSTSTSSGTGPPSLGAAAVASVAPQGGGGGGGGGSLLPRVVPTTTEHMRVYLEAEARRQARLAERQRMRSDPQLAQQAELCRLRPITHRDGGPTLPPSITPPWLSTPCVSTQDLRAMALAAAANQSSSGQEQAAPGSQLNTSQQQAAAGNPAASIQPAAAAASAGKRRSLDDQLSQAVRRSLDGRPARSGAQEQDRTQLLIQSASSSAPPQDSTAVQPGSHALAGLDKEMSRVSSMSSFAASLLEDVHGAYEDGHAVGNPHSRPRRSSAAAVVGPAAAAGTLAGQSSSSGFGSAAEQAQEQRVCVISPSLTVAYMTQSIMPHHANTIGITFGGQVMRWMELCAYISASRLRAPHLLTAAVDSLTFVRPTCVGDILYVTSQVTAIFGSSMEVHVSVHGEDPQVGELFHCADGYVTVVAVAARDEPQGADTEGGAGGPGGYAPVQLPFKLEPGTPAEMIQAKAAIQRRDARLQLRAALDQSNLSRQHSLGMDR